MLKPLSSLVAALLLVTYGVHRLNATFDFKWFWWNVIILGIVIILEELYYRRGEVRGFRKKPAATTPSNESAA